MADVVRIGISRCLLGERVRWDGGHKRDACLVEAFGRQVTWVPVCPEVESGLPVPREPLRLERSPHGGVEVNGLLVRLIMPASAGDWTDEMAEYADARVKALAASSLDGFILKRNSPSCGLHRVKVYGGGRGIGEPKGRGIFAEFLVRTLPHLPVEEEGRLADPALREHFIERVCAHARLRALFDGRWTLEQLVAFHEAHRLTLLAHHPTAWQTLDRLLTRAMAASREKTSPRATARRKTPSRVEMRQPTLSRTDVREQYTAAFMKALSATATPTRHTAVMRHMLGHLRGHVEADVRRELRERVEEYRRGLVPLMVPLTLMQHYARRHGVGSLLGQTYLEPSPRELAPGHHA